MTELAKAKRKETILTHIAAWQFLAFILLVCLVWAIEGLNLGARPTGVSAGESMVSRACVLTAAIIVCAIISVGNTYIQQKHILRGILLLCTSCSKVRVKRDVWESLGDLVEDRTLATLNQDLCPECFKSVEREITAANVQTWKVKT